MASFSKNTLSTKGILVWLSCAIFFTYEFLLRTVLGTFQHPITYDLHLSPMSFAMISSTAYQIIYALMQIPVAMLIQRLGLKKSLLLATMVCSISVAMFSAAQTVYSAFMIRLFVGFGASFGFISLLVTVYEWLPETKTAFYIGVSQFIGTMGPMLAAGPLDSLTTHYSLTWRSVHLTLSLIGLLLAIPIYFFVENNKNYISTFRVLKRKVGVWGTLTVLCKAKEAWIIALFSACIYFSIEYFSENSGKAYLLLQGYDSQFAGYLVSAAWLSYAISCPLQGYISDRIGRRKPLLVFSAFVGIISLLIIIFFPLMEDLLLLGFVLLGVSASGQSVGFAIIAEQFNKAYISTGLGLNNALIALMIALNAPLIGKLLLLLSQFNADQLGAYQMAFTLILCLIGIAFVLSIFCIKETFCKSKKDPYILFVPQKAKPSP